MAKIVIAGGCFWGVEEYFRRLEGVNETKVGYVNGTKANLTYQEVCSSQYQAREGVEIIYDEKVLSLEKILEHLFRIIDPTSLDKQGGDIGISYRTGIYFENKEEEKIALDFIFKQEANYNKDIVVEVEKLERFDAAEDYHQMYLVKNPGGYCHVDFNKIKQEELKSEYQK